MPSSSVLSANQIAASAEFFFPLPTDFKLAYLKAKRLIFYICEF